VPRVERSMRLWASFYEIRNVTISSDDGEDAATMSDVKQPSNKTIFYVMPWVILFLFLQGANENIIQLIVPIMADYYDATKAKISLVVTIAGIISGVGGTVYSILTEKFSMRQLYLFGLMMFSGGSFLAFALHPWFEWLIVARFIQCVGAIAANGCYIVLVSRYIPAKSQSLFFAMSSAMFLLALSLGTLTGALITNYLVWKYALLLPLFALLSLPAFLKYLPADRRGGNNLDIVGAILVALSILFMIFTISLQNIICMVAAILFMVTYYMYAKRRENPFLDLSLLRIRGLKPMLLMVFLLFGAQSVILFLLPFIVRDLYALDLIQIGLLFLSANAPAILAVLLIRKCVNRFGRTTVFYIGWLLFFLSLVTFALSMGGPIAMIWIAMLLFAISCPFFYTGIVMATTSLFPADKVGTGTALFLLSMGCGNSIFVAVVGLMLTTQVVDFKLLPYISEMNGASGFSNVFLLTALLFCLILIMYRKIHGKRDGK